MSKEAKKRRYVVNGRRVVMATSCRGAIEQATKLKVNTHHLRLTDDHDGAELADVVRRMVKEANLTADEREFLADHGKAALDAEKEIEPGKKRRVLDDDARAELKEALKAHKVAA